DGFCPELDEPFAVFFSIFDHLHAFAGDKEVPILIFGIGDELAQLFHPVRFPHHDLLDGIFDQRHILRTGRKHGQYVARIDGLEEVQVGAVFQELWTNGRKWTEQKAFLSLDISPVQMRHSHRRRIRRLFPVYFCAVHTYHFRVVAYQERTADRESAELPALRYTSL